MILSRKWLNEFVDCSAWSDHDFSEAMTLSGSKVETFTDLHKNIQNVVAGRIVEMVRHTNSDHMWVCQVDVGGDAPIQIVTGAQPIDYFDTFVSEWKRLGGDAIAQEVQEYFAQ